MVELKWQSAGLVLRISQCRMYVRPEDCRALASAIVIFDDDDEEVRQDLSLKVLN